MYEGFIILKIIHFYVCFYAVCAKRELHDFFSRTQKSPCPLYLSLSKLYCWFLSTLLLGVTCLSNVSPLLCDTSSPYPILSICEIHKVKPKWDGWNSVTTKDSSELWNREMNQALDRKDWVDSETNASYCIKLYPLISSQQLEFSRRKRNHDFIRNRIVVLWVDFILHEKLNWGMSVE